VDSYLKSKIISQNIRKILYLSQKINFRSVVNTPDDITNCAEIAAKLQQQLNIVDQVFLETGLKLILTKQR
jgi:hypothetical protein